mmetsp:Transcript_18812/g.45458  ORF Transcript_18812/g.45458 Transcript_18812/m.45458 type:complete len:407 (+) Transcript_18812:285-1505(+)
MSVVSGRCQQARGGPSVSSSSCTRTSRRCLGPSSFQRKPITVVLSTIILLVIMKIVDDENYNGFVFGWTMTARTTTTRTTTATTTMSTTQTQLLQRFSTLPSSLLRKTAPTRSNGGLLKMGATPESLFGDLDEPTMNKDADDDEDTAAEGDKSSSSSSGGSTADDYPTHDSIDWSEFNPFEGLTFQEYEQKYVFNSDGTTPIDEIEWDPSVPTFNSLHVVGRVGSIGELKYLGGGPADPAMGQSNNQNSCVIQMSVALPRYYNYWERKDFNVEYGQEETEWYNCEIWGQTAEFVAKNVRKGMRVGIMGAIDTDFYESRREGSEGMLSTNLKVIVQDVDILESKIESETRQENQRGPSFYTNDNDSSYGGGYGGGSAGGGRGSGGYGGSDDDTYDPASGSSGGFFDP